MKYFLLHGILVTLFVLLIQNLSSAQDMVQTFRGDEINRRSFTFEEQTFLNILSFDYDPSHEKEWDLARNGYRGTAGSLNSRELYLNQQMKYNPQLNDWVSFRFDFLQAEDYDSRYIRTVFEPEATLDKNWIFSAPLQLATDKDSIDVGLGVKYTDESIHYLKLSYIAQNAFYNSETLQDREYEKNPGTLAFQGSVSVLEGLWMKWTIGEIFPLVWDVNDLGYQFDFRKFYYDYFTQYTVDDKSDLYLTISGEQTAKAFDYSTANIQDHHLSRSAARVKAEYRKRFTEDEFQLGFQYYGLRESDNYSNDPNASHIIRRREYTPYVGYRFQFDTKASLYTTLYVDFMNNKETVPGTPPTIVIDDNPLSKMSFAFQYDFSSRAHLRINPTLQFFGSTPYGGTDVQLTVTF